MPRRWADVFSRLFEVFGSAMLRSEDRRAVAIFEPELPDRAPFAQYLIEPEGLLLDLPTTSVDGEARQRLLAAGLGLRRAAEVPELCPPEPEDGSFDPLRKEYSWRELERAADELAWLLFGFWATPLAGPVKLSWWAEGGAPLQQVLLAAAVPEEALVH